MDTSMVFFWFLFEGKPYFFRFIIQIQKIYRKKAVEEEEEEEK